MPSRGPRRVLALVASTGVALLGVTACQDSPDPDPTGGSGSATSSTPSPSPTSNESLSLPEPTPTAEPADGVLIDVPGATMNGLRTYRSIANYGLVQGWGDRQSSVILSPNLTQALSLDAWAREYVRDNSARREPRRVENGVVAGKFTAWVMEDTEDPLLDTRVYGVMYLDGAWTIDFAFREDGQPEPLAEEERQAAIDSMLATFAPHAE